jgi:hypothetical protein
MFVVYSLKWFEVYDCRVVTLGLIIDIQWRNCEQQTTNNKRPILFFFCNFSATFKNKTNTLK